MGYSTASTEWPQPSLPEKVCQLLDDLFATLDDSTDHAGDRLADYMFSPDGELVTSYSAKGAEGNGYLILLRSKLSENSCRDQGFSQECLERFKKRRHEILKVYTSSSKDLDLLLLGNISVELNNEKSLTTPFAARVVIKSTNNNDPRIQFYQGIVVGHP